MENFDNRYSVLRAVFNITPNITFVKNTDYVYIAASEQFAKMLGKKSATEVIGKTDMELFEPSLAQKHRMEDNWILRNRDNIKNILEEFQNADGTVRYDSISKYYLEDEKGDLLGIYGLQYDVTKDVLEQRQYEQEIQYLFELDETTCFTLLLDVDEWKIRHLKQSAVWDTYVGLEKNVEMFCEIALKGVCSMESEAYSFYKKFSPEYIKSIYFSGRRDVTLKYQRRWKNEEVRWLKDSIKFLKNPENGHLLLALVVKDIEAEKQSEQELIRRAETDGLTGVFNRESFLKKVQHVLSTEGYNGTHALFMLDIDNFKALNDTKGHQSGDRFLVEISQAIRKCFRSTDIVGRLGGDEFFVLMRYTPEYSVTKKNANALLTSINELCSKYEIKGLSVSIGVSVYPENGTTFEELYEQADKALYRAKVKGKSRFEFATERENL